MRGTFMTIQPALLADRICGNKMPLDAKFIA